MKSLYTSPLRVYLFLGALSIVGIFCGMSLPVSLFPNSAKPVVFASLPLGDMTAKDFLDSYGAGIESSIAAINTEQVRVEKIEATYNKSSVSYMINFPWGTPPNEALKEVENIITRTTSVLPEEIRRGSFVNNWSENGGFFAASFYSSTRELNDLYKTLNLVFSADLKKIHDATGAALWNPAEREIQVELKPDSLTQYQLLPVDITRVLLNAMQSFQAGSVDIAGKSLQIIVKAAALKREDLTGILLTTPSGRTIHLGDIAKIDFTTPLDKSRIIRTSGALSVIMFANPKPGGNIKRMSEDIVALIQAKKKNLPPDIKHKILVDPSEFIRSSVNNVVHEVALAAGLAVLVLFFFIGSFKNVITAAIEIPMSIVLAFILMKLTNMNLNLISLGGLALSAGMNVDGSVVVMENIFRHFEKAKGKLDAALKLKILLEAVNEVKLPIIASTVASIVVFAPLIFTKGLSSAILGDLAKAVIFSHGLSAVVALILVPTVRLHMMQTETNFNPTSLFEKHFVRLENFYRLCLDIFLKKNRMRQLIYVVLFLSLLGMVKFIIPVLPKEVIGTPDTDWVVFVQMSQGNSLIRQMETQSEEIEAIILTSLGEKVDYTFTQINSPNTCVIMLRLKDKKMMADVMKQLESEFPNTPLTQYAVEQWNPSELTLPNPANFKISIRSQESKDMLVANKEIYDLLQEKQYYHRLQSVPDADSINLEGITVIPRLELWPEMVKSGSKITPSDIGDYVRVATQGKPIGYMAVEGRSTKITLKFPTQYVNSVEELRALPVNIAGKLVPLKAIAQIDNQPSEPVISRINQQEEASISGRLKKEDRKTSPEVFKNASKLITEWKKTSQLAKKVSVSFENPEKEVEEAINQLLVALGISMGLILVTMILQLGHVMNSILVFMAIPLGLIGVLLSLFIFKSTLSLNSLLGVILLNGIAVANSIILVDFLNRLVARGMAPHEAALEAARTRLRPILMTSLTTTLGMLPIALGLGERGRILQPLGIAVSGGLGVSMLLTLFIVPALQVSYLNFVQKRKF